MKVGFFSPYLDTFGGGERYMLTLASYLAEKHDVEIFWGDSAIKAPLTRFLKIDLQKTKFVENIFGQSFLKKIRRTASYDLIFVLSDGSVPFSFAKKNILHFQVPFVFPKIDAKTKLNLIRYKYVVVNSHFTKKFIDKSFNVDSKVIYPPVDVQSLKPGKKEKLIISVGRFSQQQLHPKQQEVLIEVFKELYKDVPSWKLVLAGQSKKEDYKYIKNLKRSVKGYAIRILENIPYDELKVLYGRASIYWHATGFGEDEIRNPQKMEHFGISTVEAQAAGAVPVVIEKGGQKEIVEDKKNGRLWSTKTQLYEITKNLIETKGEMLRLSQRAVADSKRFSQEKFIKEYEKIILP